MTAALHGDYVDRAMEKSLTRRGALTVLGVPIDLGRITVDSYVVAGLAEHITDCRHSSTSSPTSTTTAARTARCPTERPQPPPTTPARRPRPTAERDNDTHDRVRHDKISKAGTVTLRVAGRLRHIGVGRTYAGTYVILLIQDLDVRVVHAATGELLRELTIDPRRDYQPTGRPPGPTRK